MAAGEGRHDAMLDRTHPNPNHSMCLPPSLPYMLEVCLQSSTPNTFNPPISTTPQSIPFFHSCRLPVSSTIPVGCLVAYPPLFLSKLQIEITDLFSERHSSHKFLAICCGAPEATKSWPAAAWTMTSCTRNTAASLDIAVSLHSLQPTPLH